MIYPLQLTDGILFIDNSSLSVINDCLRKSSYKLALKKKQARDETALKFGGIMHKVLEQRYGFDDYAMVTDAATKRMFDRAVAEFSQWSPPGDDFRNIECAVNCIQKYNLHYLVEPFDIIQVNDKKGMETPFAVPLTELEINDTVWVKDTTEEEIKQVYIKTLPVIFTGKIDLVVKDATGLWVMDHKTSSIGGGNFFADFYTSMQFKGYIWALRSILDTKAYASGVIINGIINRRPTRTGKSCEFLRDKIGLDPAHIDEWKESFIRTIDLYISCVIAQDFPMQTSMCIHKYGRCEFYDVCILPPQQRAMMLSTGQYVEDKWSPLLDESEPTVTEFQP